MAIEKSVEYRKVALYYGSISFFITMLQNIFLLYHIEIFVSVRKIDRLSFWVAEIVFLIWNSCNDPLFGWLSDKKYLMHFASDKEIVLNRLRALRWSGPMLAISFMAFWLSLTYPAIQFVVCLCVYDGFLTAVDLHHSALLADLALSSSARNSLNLHSSVFSACGSLSVFLSYLVWNKSQLVPFQLLCLLLTIVAGVGFFLVTSQIREAYSSATGVSYDERHSSPDTGAVKQFVREVSKHKNFLWFSAMHFIQVFHCHFNSNFFPLFLTVLLDDVPQLICSLILGLSFVAPHVNNIVFLRLCDKFGTYYIIRALFIVKLSFSVFMFLMGPNYLWLLCLFIASNRVFTEGTCKLLNLVISDLVDEDVVINSRKSAVSALIFGSAAFLAKPGQTLAPLVGTWLLARTTGHDVFESGGSLGSMKFSADMLSTVDLVQYRAGTFHLLLAVAIGCAVVQLLCWSRFSLRDQWLALVKQARLHPGFTIV